MPRLVLAVALLLAACAPTAERYKKSNTETLHSFRDWAAHYNHGLCWIATHARPSGAAVISTLARDGSAAISVVAEDGLANPGILLPSGQRLPMFSRGKNAWIRSEQHDQALHRILMTDASVRSMMFERSVGGNVLTDRFSTLGYARNFRAARASCGRSEERIVNRVKNKAPGYRGNCRIDPAAKSARC